MHSLNVMLLKKNYLMSLIKYNKIDPINAWIQRFFKDLSISKAIHMQNVYVLDAVNNLHFSY